MNITTKTTRTHLATFSAEDIKAVALSAVRKQVGLGDDAKVVSSVANVGTDGAVTVEIVVDASAEPVAPVAAAAPAPVPSITIPAGLGGIAPAPTADILSNQVPIG